MSFDIGINFRQTAGYVTDPANTTHSLDETYPITRDGVTFGWVDAAGGNGRNRSASTDPRLAGIGYRNGAGATKMRFRLDLPASGSVNIYCAIGDATGGNPGYLEIFDDTASLGVLVPKHTGIPAGRFYDATDTLHLAANWPGSNAKATLTFSTTTLIAAITPGDSLGGNYTIAHLRVVQVEDTPHNLTGAASTQAHAGGTAAITQAHALSGTVSVQINASGAGTVALGATNTLARAASTQGNAGSAALIDQAHILGVSASAQINASGATAITAITQAHVLAGANSIQANSGAIDAISISGDFVGAPSAQANLSGTGRITRAQTLSGANSAQANLAGTGAISDGIVVEAALTAGSATTVRIKKPGIPAGTPEWLKTLLEIVIGRRGNAIKVPKFETLTFSASPTKAECEALYSYINKVRAAVQNIITRLDS